MKLPIPAVLALFGAAGLIGLSVYLIQGKEGGPAGTPVAKSAARPNSRPSTEQQNTTTTGGNPHKSDSKREIKADLTPDQARQALQKFYASNNDLKKRSELLCEMISKLCENGYSLEAWDLIDPGYGTLRKDSLRAFFNVAQLSQNQVLDFLRKCDGKGDLSDALCGYFRRFAPKDLVSMITDPDMARVISEMEKSGQVANVNIWLSSSLQTAKDQFHSSDEEISSTAMALYSKGLLKPNDVMILAKYDDPENIFSKWDQLKVLPRDAPQDGDGGVGKREKMISTMINSDAPRAMEMILGGKEGENFSDIQTAVQNWSRVDAQGAADWYQKAKTRLTEKQQSIVAQSFSYEAYQAGELDVARQWIEQIQDPARRTAGLQAIDNELKKREGKPD